MSRQKSAEAIVVVGLPPRRAEQFSPSGAKHSMSDSRRPQADMPERRPRVGGEVAEGKPRARQADTACDEYAGQAIPVIMEEGSEIVPSEPEPGAE